jgi:Flp pilus assembly protein TadG
MRSATILRKCRHRATATVEFALLAPILAAILMGSIELARAVMVKGILTDAARDGARIGALRVKGNSIISNTNVTTDINNILTDNGIDSTKANIVIKVNGVVADVNTANAGDQISVQVWMYYSDAGWIRLGFLTSTSIASEFLVMMKEG